MDKYIIVTTLCDKEKRIFEKAKSALIKLGRYSDDKENRDETKINDMSLESLLSSALIGMHEAFRGIESKSIQNADIRRLYQRNRSRLLRGDFEDIDEVKDILSQLLPTLQESGLIDKNEIALSMMESVYNDKKVEWKIYHSISSYSNFSSYSICFSGSR